MTREEAIEKVKALPGWSAMPRDAAALHIESLIALGLLTLDPPPTKHRRWAVIAIEDNCPPRSGYAYLYKEKPKNTAVSGIGREAIACIEIEFTEGEGLTNIPRTFELK
jgi:hypothetical protein